MRRSRPCPVGVVLVLPLLAAVCAKDDKESSALIRSHRGNAVAYADFDGDGFTDWLIGAPLATGKTRSGGLLVHRGDAAGGFAKDPTWVWGETANDQFGTAIEPVGDLDGGGKSDLVVTAPMAGRDIPVTGAVYVYRGETPGSAVRLDGLVAGDRFGHAVASGDLDHDGQVDLVVSAVRASSANYQAGDVYVYLAGAAAAGGPPSRTIAGGKANGGFGTALGILDLNGDGTDDLVVASAGESVRVYFGGAAFAPAWDKPDVEIFAWGSDYTMPAPHVASSFGQTLVAMGDVNGDGIADLGIGNPRRSRFDLYDGKGAFYVYRGAAMLPAKLYTDSAAEDEAKTKFLVATILGHRNLDCFSETVVMMGDIDGRGRPDFLVGAPWSNEGVPVGGAVYVFNGEDLAMYTNASMAAAALRGDQQGGEFGGALAFNSDTHRLLVGSPHRDLNTGRAVELDLHAATPPGGGQGGGGHDHH